jgi:hypothetical protein
VRWDAALGLAWVRVLVVWPGHVLHEGMDAKGMTRKLAEGPAERWGNPKLIGKSEEMLMVVNP